ncbi:MAG: cell envelope integrity protein TolA [Pseudomonadota bacterium]|nr:cell envelope integrity protein TolA [Pseudomonadota bacterium]
MITKTALFLSGLLHSVVAIVLLLTIDSDSRETKPSGPGVKSVNAIVVKDEVLIAEVARLQAIENKEKIANENELRNLRRKINKLQSKNQEELKALKGLRSEKDRISREKSQALKKRDVELKKAADAKQQADDESKRLLEARRLREEAELRKERTEKEVAEAERLLAETELQAEIKSEEVLQEHSEQKAHDAELIDRYAAAIRSRVLENYTVLPGHEGLECTLRINLIRDGHVAGVEVIKSSNNPSFDRLAETAVRKVVPLPVPDDDRIFEKMKVISFVFKPPRI